MSPLQCTVAQLIGGWFKPVLALCSACCFSGLSNSWVYLIRPGIKILRPGFS
jgi:hypothetical protein